MSDLFAIAGKTAVVTGGATGIGAMITRGYIEAGAKVYISSRKLDAITAFAEEMSALPGSAGCIPVAANLADHDECRRVASEISEREGGRLDILVNNAGANWGEAYETFPDAAWDRVLDLNVKGVFHLTRYLTPALAAAGTAEDPARVINIGSIDGIQVPVLDTYSYSASKAAVHHLTKVLARKLAPQHITVNAIAPGPFRSKMMNATLDAAHDLIVSQVPLGRIGEPDDLAGISILLAARAGAWMTGCIIPVDGGMATTK